MDHCQFLSQYKLDEHYLKCNKYLNNSINWNSISKEIQKNGPTYIDVSSVISLFPHLELDENYKLFCYLSLEYHGIYGRVAAVKNGEDTKPIVDLEKRSLKASKGKRFELPEGAVPPMEAIYHNGTNEGYFEAVLCSIFLDAIPYTHFEQNHWNVIMNEPPSNIKDRWDTSVDISDWAPRVVDNTVIAFVQKIENGIGGSDGRDRIYLTQFYFQKRLGFYHAFKADNIHSMYKNQIDDDKRYNDERHCCVFTSSSVLITREKAQGNYGKQ